MGQQLGQDRTFPNDPNPPPSAMTPEPPKMPSTPAPQTSGGTGALPPSKVDDVSPLSSSADNSKPEQRLSITEGADGTHQAFMTTPKDGDVPLGNCSLGKADLEPILKASGAHYDPALKMYDDIPEATLKACMSGRPSTLDAIKRNFNAGEADLVRGAAFEGVLTGKKTVPEALEVSNPERVQALAQGAWSPWHGLGEAFAKFEAHPVDTSEDFAKWSIGKTASFLPSISEVTKAGAVGTMVGGTIPALFGQPELIPAGMKAGAAAGSFLSLYHMSLGGDVAHMADQGYTTEQIRKEGATLAVSAGVSSAAWMFGVEAMASSFAKMAFFQGLAKSESAQKVIASWAYKFGMDLGVKMPTLGAVQSAISDFTSNMVAHLEGRPDLLNSAQDMVKHAAWGALDMMVGGAPLGLAGAGMEALKGRQSAAAEAALGARVSKQLEGVERREPSAIPPPGDQTSGRASGEGGLPSSQTGEKASQEPVAGKPPSPFPNSEEPALWQKTPLPKSIEEHPAFVKSVEDAAPHLPEGVDAKDKGGVVKAYIAAADEAHKFEGSYETIKQAGKEGMTQFTPEQEVEMQAKWLDAMKRMMGLKDLATFYRDPERQTAYKEWIADGQEGEQPEKPIDPHGEARGDYKYGMRETSASQKLDLMLTGKGGEATSEKILSGLDEAIHEESARDKKQAGSLEQKTRNVEAESRLNAVNTDLKNVDQKIGELAHVRDRMQKHGLATGALDRQLNDLFEQKANLTHDVAFYTEKSKAAMVEPNERLEMKPATLEDIVNIGFKEGGKQSQARARELLAIAKENGLTANDVKKLVGNKMIGAMGDVQYRNFLEGIEKEGEHIPGFREGVAKLVEKKAARMEAAQVLKDRQIENAQHIKKLYNMPSAAKMTTEQFKQYADILRSYDKADVAFTAKRVEALKGTPLEGARTEGEARGKIAELKGLPVEDFKNIKLGHLARALPEPAVRYWHPALGYIFDTVNEVMGKGKRLADVIDERQKALAVEAIKERHAKTGIGERVADFFAPQQRRVFQYLEAKEPQDIAARAAELTPAELKWGDWARSWLGVARADLERKGMTSRFIDSYAPHTAKGLPEIIRDAKRVGLWGSLKELVPSEWRRGTGEVIDHGENVLGFEKKLQQSRFRSGALDPSQNLVKALSGYIHDYYNKAALDQVTPYVQTISDTLEAKDPEGEKFGTSMASYTKAYLNNKKGINYSAGTFGEMLAPVLRFASSAVSLKYIAFNLPLEAAKGGLAVPIAKFMAINNPVDFARTIGLRWTEEGKTFLKNQEHVIGKDFVERLKDPANDLGDYTNEALYSGYVTAHQRAIGDVLLAAATPDELKSGKMSDARITEVLGSAGRWLAFNEHESIYMQNPPGKSGMQYKKWFVPPTLTLAEDAHALYRSIVSGGKERMTPQQVHETLKLGMMAAAAAAGGSLLTKDMEDDSVRGQLVHYLRRSMSSLWHGISPAVWLSAAGPAYLAKLGVDLSMLGSLEEDKNGNNKAWERFKKDVTPRMWQDAAKVSKYMNGDD